MFFRRILAAVIFALAVAGSVSVSAQPPEDDRGRQRVGPEELPKNIRETLAKQRIEREKKEYEELLKRSEEAVRLSDELEKKFAESPKVTTEDVKKLEQLEKLVRKIRSDLGGSDDAENDPEQTEKIEKPDSIASAFKSLQSNAVKLLDEIKKSTRHSISVMAIQSSNVLLKVLKFIRIGN